MQPNKKKKQQDRKTLNFNIINKCKLLENGTRIFDIFKINSKLFLIPKLA